MKRWLILLALIATAPARAEWVLNSDQSSLTFVSTKAINIAEVHRFGTLIGGVDSNGQAAIVINLVSVDTAIEIRDDRMRDMLFNTAENPTATISAKVDNAVLDSLESGESADMSVEAMLSLNGNERPVTMDVVAARTGETKLLVTTRRPVVIYASDYGLADGVEALREVAGLPSISLAVPVSFVLSFDER